MLVLDPMCDPAWEADYITNNPTEFLSVFWKSRSCMAFMDEGGESVGRYDTTMSKTATRGRHWGHTCHYIAQKATQLAPLVRDQCTRVFAFCGSEKDGKVLAGEWNKPELETIHTLKQGEYIYAVKMGGISTNRSKEDGTISDRGRTRNGSRGSVDVSGGRGQENGVNADIGDETGESEAGEGGRNGSSAGVSG